MKVVALISGGKDSTFNMMQCIAAGHQIVALANLVPHNKTELDSFMYQSVGHEAIDFIAAAMDLPLYKRDTFGISNERGKIYKPSDNDEVEDLYLLLEQILKEIEIDAVSVGAILSDYQRVRVENVCIRLGLIPLAYLWQQNQKELLDEMIKCEVDAILIKVAALGLETKHLGRSLSLMQPHLLAMHEKYGLNICGEGGEYETLTLDCPLFKSRIVIKESKVVVHSNDPIAPVGYLVFEKLELELKLPALDLQGRLEGLPLKDSDGYVTNQGQGPFDITEDDIDDLQTSSGDASINSITYFPENIIQKALSVRSRNGWLWIGGIQGTSSDAYEAMNEAMSILKSELSLHNHSVKDICSVTMFVNDMSRYAALNELYVETFDFVNPPTRACVQVPFSQDCPLRMEVVSWKQPADSAGDEPIERNNLLNWRIMNTRRVGVQSRLYVLHLEEKGSTLNLLECLEIVGYKNLGLLPNDQILNCSPLLTLVCNEEIAGQIGLVPGSMELVKGGIKAECRLGLRHLERLLKAVDSNFNLSNVVQGICYVSNVAFVEPARKLWEEKTNNAIVEYVVVTGLPKSAAVEWHVWAHKYNNQFDYEERGKCIEKYTISIYRRWNHENNVSAILCRIGHPEEDSPFNSEVFKEAMDYTIQKLRQDHEHDTTSVINLNIFYSVSKNMDSTLFSEYFENFTKDIQLSYTLVPVISLRNRQTFLSICGVRIP